MNTAVLAVLGIAAFAGACGFLAEFADAAHRFPMPLAVARSLKSGLLAALFVGALAAVLAGIFTH